MDYEDDMYDDYNSESWVDDDDAIEDDDPMEDDDPAEAEELHSRTDKSYTILGNDEILQLQKDNITTTCSVLSVSRDSARILLHHYKWCLSEAQSEWFADNDKVRRTLGLLEKPVIAYAKNKNITCGICFDTYDYDKMHAASCGHLFCSSCWEGYISTSVSDGPGCLSLRCPEPSCCAAVGHDMIHRVASKDLEKYSHYLLRSYIENNRKMKWCPAPDCGFAVACDTVSSTYDVICKCSNSFCWNCFEEAHRPVNCETVSMWITKNSAEAENTNWILAHSKPCPKCKRPIEKNMGCMHMTCGPPCKFEFCWLCLGGWKEHSDRTGGFYSCNGYEIARKKGEYDESEKRRQMAKASLEKYTHYFERWAANNSSWVKALADLRQMESVHVKALSAKLGTPETSLKFIEEAWQQIIKCRRILKWTYAYGFYLPDGELAKKDYFEFNQGEAEAWLEKLHMCAEKELQYFLDSKPPTEEPGESSFKDFQSKLTGLTRVTGNYFEKLLEDLESGLSRVSHGVGSSSSKGKADEKQKSPTATGDDEFDYWQCDRCTFANVSTRRVCEMCDQGY